MKKGKKIVSLLARKFNVFCVSGSGQEPGAQVMITPTPCELETICRCPGWMTWVSSIFAHGFLFLGSGYLVCPPRQICACMGVALLFLIPSEIFFSRER